MPEALEAVTRMLSAYPRLDVPKSYIGTLAALMLQYPKSIALECCNPVLGLPRTIKFPPAIAEAVAWMEAAQRPLANAARRERQIREQLTERDRIETEEKAEPLEKRMDVAERVKSKLREAGFKFSDDRKSHGETPANVREKYKVSQADWDALPDQPGNADYWQRVRWPK